MSVEILQDTQWPTFKPIYRKDFTLLLHTHWQPPHLRRARGLCVWTETSDAPQPPRQRGRLANKPGAKAHPFCLELEGLYEIDFLQEPLLLHGVERQITLRLSDRQS